MVREWRAVLMMKRGGRGHDVGGVAQTGQGELAVLCPACPQPGINLPPDWKHAEKRSVFVLHCENSGSDGCH